MQAPAPARIVEGGIPTEALIAQVLVAKYADHLPLYRQAQIYARQGIELDRSTLAAWVGRAAWYLRPLRDHILERLRRSPPRCCSVLTRVEQNFDRCDSEAKCSRSTLWRLKLLLFFSPPQLPLDRLANKLRKLTVSDLRFDPADRVHG